LPAGNEFLDHSSMTSQFIVVLNPFIASIRFTDEHRVNGRNWSMKRRG